MLCTNFLYLIFSEAKWPYQEWQSPSIYNTRNKTPFSYLPYPTVIVWCSTGMVNMPPMLSLCPNQTAVISYGPSFPMSLNAVFLSKCSRQLSPNWSETVSDKKPICFPQSEGKGKALESLKVCVLLPLLPLTSSVAYGRSFLFSEPQFPYLWNREIRMVMKIHSDKTLGT